MPRPPPGAEGPYLKEKDLTSGQSRSGPDSLPAAFAASAARDVGGRAAGFPPSPPAAQAPCCDRSRSSPGPIRRGSASRRCAALPRAAPAHAVALYGGARQEVPRSAAARVGAPPDAAPPHAAPARHVTRAHGCAVAAPPERRRRANARRAADRHRVADRHRAADRHGCDRGRRGCGAHGAALRLRAPGAGPAPGLRRPGASGTAALHQRWQPADAVAAVAAGGPRSGRRSWR